MTSNAVAQHLLKEYACEALSDGRFNVVDHARVSRIALKTLTPGVAFFGRFPFKAICLKLGGNNYKGWALAAGNIASYTALIFWALYSMVDDTLSPKSDTKKMLLRSSCCHTFARVSTASAIGIAAQLPFAYLAYQYNDNEIIMPILILATDTIIPTYSSYLSMKQFSNLREYLEFPKDLKVAQKEIRALLTEAKQVILRLDENSDAYVEKMNEVARSADSDKLQALLLFLQSNRKPKALNSKSCLKSTCFRVYQLALLALLTGDMIAIGAIGYNGWKTLDHDRSPEHAYIAGAAFSVLANLYLFGMCIEETGNKIFKLITGNYEKTLADRTLPKSSFVAKALGTMTACLSWGPSVQVGKDYFDGYFSYWQQATMSGATVLLVLTAIIDVIDAALQQLILFSNEQKTIRAIKAVEIIDQITDVLDHIKPQDLRTYLNDLPQEFKTNETQSERSHLLGSNL